MTKKKKNPKNLVINHNDSELTKTRLKERTDPPLQISMQDRNTILQNTKKNKKTINDTDII